MLKNTPAFSGFSVNDINKAKDFYGNTLGLDVTSEEMGLLGIHLANGTDIMVYPKDDHQPATFTILNFPVDSVERAVTDLKAKGVKFEQYDMPGLKTDTNGIADGGAEGPKMAWFKDPSGNILSVLEEPK